METNADTTQNKNNANSRMLGTALALILAVAAFFAGTQFEHPFAVSNSEAAGDEQSANILSALFGARTTPDAEADLSEFWRVWNLMDEKFVAASSTDELNAEQKLHGAIQGLVRSYEDPYSVFLPPRDAEQFGENIAGNFGGVGMEVGVRNDVITVISPLPNTPAEAAGLVAGDAIIEIDGETTEGMSIDEAVRRIRGEKGTQVELTIFRDGAGELKEISVTRDTISIPTIETELRDDTFIISLYSFNALAEMKMQEALREYTQSGTQKLILDVRGNPGGYLQSAVAIASYFLPAGEVIVREQFGEGKSEELYRSQGRTLRQFAPEEMVILINGGSASASEILAGALQEYGVATLIGDTTFGKGSVQELVELPDGSSLKVTVARWLTPKGRSISLNGLEPDITIERTIEQVQSGEDPQLEAAIEWVNGNKDIGETASSTAFYLEE